MQKTMPPLTIPESQQSGFVAVDEKGRVALPETVRKVLSIESGSSLAYAVIDGMLVLFSQDKHLALLMEQAAKVLTDADLTVQALLDELPAIRDKVVREMYGDEFIDELEHKYGHLVGTALTDRIDNGDEQ